MKRALWPALVVLAIGATPATRAEAPQDSIDIDGVTLKLGLAEGSVLQQLGDIFGLSEAPNKAASTWIVTRKGHPEIPVGSVTFQEQKLTYVSKIWTVDEPDTEGALGNAIYGVVSSFEKEGRTICAIDAGQSQGPTLERKEVTISCGNKYLEIDIFRVGKQGETASVTEVLQR